MLTVSSTLGSSTSNGLEAPLQSWVFLYVLAVFIDGGRADHVQLASRQHRLEHVAGIHSAFCSPRADHGMHLIYE
jgi:hypothetical protein